MEVLTSDISWDFYTGGGVPITVLELIKVDLHVGVTFLFCRYVATNRRGATSSRLIAALRVVLLARFLII